MFQRFLSSPKEFGPPTRAIGSSLKLSFHPCKEHPKRTPYAAHASILVRAASGLRDELELEFLWTSTLDTRTESTSGLLHDLDTLAGLLSLDAMHQSWSYAWVSCPHHVCDNHTPALMFCQVRSKFKRGGRNERSRENRTNSGGNSSRAA